MAIRVRGIAPGVTMFRNEALALGRFKRDPDRWQTEFGRWVADFGVPRIVAGLAHDPDLRITNQTVYEWLQGQRPPSSPRHGPRQDVPNLKLRPPFVFGSGTACYSRV